MNIFIFFFFTFFLSGWTNNISNPLRTCDLNGRLLKEIFPNGKSIEISYDELSRVVQILLEGTGSIVYKYDDTKLLEVSRVALNGQKIYSQSYVYDNLGNLFYQNLISK